MPFPLPCSLRQVNVIATVVPAKVVAAAAVVATAAVVAAAATLTDAYSFGGSPSLCSEFVVGVSINGGGSPQERVVQPRAGGEGEGTDRTGSR